MSGKRRTRREAGSLNALGRACTRKIRKSLCDLIVQYLPRLSEDIARQVNDDPTRIFNSDMSLEIDRLIVALDREREWRQERERDLRRERYIVERLDEVVAELRERIQELESGERE